VRPRGLFTRLAHETTWFFCSRGAPSPRRSMLADYQLVVAAEILVWGCSPLVRLVYGFGGICPSRRALLRQGCYGFNVATSVRARHVERARMGVARHPVRDPTGYIATRVRRITS